MKARCDNPDHPRAVYYSEKGITYTEKWREFAGFYEDMFPSWSPGLILDRSNNDKDYCKENCRWVSKTESQRHRKGVNLNQETADEIRKLWNEGYSSFQQLAGQFGVSYNTVYKVVRNKTWTI